MLGTVPTHKNKKIGSDVVHFLQERLQRRVVQIVVHRERTTCDDDAHRLAVKVLGRVMLIVEDFLVGRFWLFHRRHLRVTRRVRWAPSICYAGGLGVPVKPPIL